MAGLLTKRFGYSGDITEIHRQTVCIGTVNFVNHTTGSGTFRSLAANCITQHRFLQAQLYIDSALVLGDDKYLTVLMEFDIAMELGNQYRARQALNSLADKTSFEYLIREAKYKDHVEGNLDAAITLLEKAYDKIKDNPSPCTVSLDQIEPGGFLRSCQPLPQIVPMLPRCACEKPALLPCIERNCLAGLFTR